jgi:hypothetical protein
MIPASIRNKNPGAMEPGPSSAKFGSTAYETLKWTYKGKPAINKCATFPTEQHGAAAMFDLLSRRYTGQTVEAAIGRWCGGYYAPTYAKALEANGGVKATDMLTKELIGNPAFAVPLCKAMARVEAGTDFPLTDEEWNEAHALAFGGAVAPEFSPDNDVPSPGPNARRTAAIKDAAPKVTVGGSVAAASTYVASNGLPTPPPQAADAAAKVGAWKGLATSASADPLLMVGLLVVFGVLGWIAFDKWRGA